MASKVFVGNLSFNTTRSEIESIFAQAGTITDLYLPTDRATGRMRGFAFITFESDEAAEKAIRDFNGHQLGGRPLRVNPAEERPMRAPQFGNDAPSFGGGGGGGRGGSGGGGGGGGDRFGGAGKPKGSRRNIRAKKRTL